MDQEQIRCPQKRGRFVNPNILDEKRTLWDVVLWKLGYYRDAHPLPAQPEGFSYPEKAKPFEREAPSAVWVGHSTYLIDFGGWKLLTDPVWDQYCSPVPISGLRRRTEVPFPLDTLGKLNAVLISHNHYDHLDQRAVLQIARQYPNLRWILPKKLGPWFERRKIRPWIELDWWQSVEIDGHRITAVPT